ncbi:hypothetical protein M9H77_30807 [Catharanthus roseus]|uniref:Uncharacterized protein n=1 Tax=Catharanthus roseus TaxID=4058 RepID=A0ACB9ZYA3_CATRO|nr:hypothetical protein M9H77_30807 [Catharanthus roseus]
MFGRTCLILFDDKGLQEAIQAFCSDEGHSRTGLAYGYLIYVAVPDFSSLMQQKRQLQQERDLHCEEATKELNNVMFEVEAKKICLLGRQKRVEAVVTEALFKSNSIQDLLPGRDAGLAAIRAN